MGWNVRLNLSRLRAGQKVWAQLSIATRQLLPYFPVSHGEWSSVNGGAGSITNQEDSMKAFYALVCLALLSGCITAKKELNGRYTKVAQVENRSLFGTNQGFARLERCDGPEKKVLWFSESDFTNCVYLTHADQNEYE